MPSEKLSMLAEIIALEDELCGQIELFSELESQCVANDDMDEIAQAVTLKGEVVDKLMPVMDKWHSLCRALSVPCARDSAELWAALASEPEGEAVLGLRETCKSINLRMAAVMEREGDIVNDLEANMGEIRNKLARLRRGRQALQGYGNA